MALLKLKMEQMRVVNFVILLTLPMPAIGQIIDGLYSANIPGTEISYTINFSKGRFSQKTSTHLDIVELSEGFYWIIGDTLFQYYEKNSAPQNCWIENKVKVLDVLENPTDDIHISIQILNMTNNLIPLNILLRSDDNKILKTLIPDTVGNLDINLSGYTQASNILFSSLKEECEIDLIPLKGHSALIKVKLLDDNLRHSKYSGIRKFLIQKKAKKRFTLKEMDNTLIINLEKID